MRRTVFAVVVGLLLVMLPAGVAAAQSPESAPPQQVAPAASLTSPQGIADSRDVTSAASCNKVRNRIGELAAQGIAEVMCTEPDGNPPKLSSDIRAQFAQLPQWCYDHAFDGFWWITRTQICNISSRTLQIINANTGAPIGEVKFIEFNYSYTDAAFPSWAHQLGIFPHQILGAGVGTVVFARGSCQGSCSVVRSSFLPQGLTTDRPAEGEAIFDTNSKTPSAVGQAQTTFSYWFTNPCCPAPSLPNDITPPRVRCDNALPGVNGAGCIVPDYVSTMVYSLSGPYPELAQHILNAQASGLPGAWPNGQPLERLTDSVLQERNRNTACKGSYLRPAGKSCDEYPFASTWQGASTGGGSPRTFPGCSIPQVGSGSGPAGYSVCMIDETQNETGGSALNNSLYRPYRVLGRDPFRVAIVN